MLLFFDFDMLCSALLVIDPTDWVWASEYETTK
jgi:hypothetical protein